MAREETRLSIKDYMKSVEPLPSIQKAKALPINWDDIKLIESKRERAWTLHYVDLSETPGQLTIENVGKFAGGDVPT
jgi:hypothetical protein